MASPLLITIYPMHKDNTEEAVFTASSVLAYGVEHYTIPCRRKLDCQAEGRQCNRIINKKGGPNGPPFLHQCLRYYFTKLHLPCQGQHKAPGRGIPGASR